MNFEVKHSAKLAILLLLTTSLVQVSAECKYAGKAYKKGDIWYNKDNCHAYECNAKSKVTEYEAICPPLPACLPSQLYKKDCCEYCHEGTIPTDNNGHDCKRKCVSGESMSCKYTFSLEAFQTFSAACFDCPKTSSDCDRENCIPADGISRLSAVVNRMMPGPAIEVCVNDTIVVDVQNNFLSQSATIHWLGITQRFNPYADGVPYVTQCPITDFDTFRYVFPVDKPGTYSWRSLFGLEIMDGFQGSLIVRQPIEEDPHEKLYDKDEHVMFLQDWTHHYSEQKFYSHYMANETLFPDNFLINGRGRLLSPVNRSFVYSNESQTLVSQPPIPFSEFSVDSGNRYRIRIISGATSNCPLAISFDNHTMQLISTDGSDVEPVSLKQLIVNNGERYDVVINANQPTNKYWIRVKGLIKCQQLKLQQFAILRYTGSSDGDPNQSMEFEYPEVITQSTTDSTDEEGSTIQLTDLRSLEPIESGLDGEEPDYQFFINLAWTTKVKDKMVMASTDSPAEDIFQYNRISFMYPPSPLMTQPLRDPSVLCNETTLREQSKDCSKELCRCVHMVYVDLNSLVEVILFDPDTVRVVEHPIHLHGYQFRVVAVGRVPGISKQKLKDMDEQGEIKRNFDHPVQKDVVSVYKSGYTIFRFNASNPGYWYMPSTVQFHLATGMSLIIKVGEQIDLPPIPPGLPQCFNYKPT